VKHLFKWGVIHKVGNGNKTQFWNDVWLTSVPLRLTFNRLFSICEECSISVADCAARDWQVGFRRMLGSEECEEWRELQQLLLPVVLTDFEDLVAWGLSPKKHSLLARCTGSWCLEAWTAGWQKNSGNAGSL
jgi:hypothetical protein